MNLTQAEIIQMLRRRINMNQGDFGALAFSTSFESGRTKVKNIELGKQTPTDEDLEKMARVFGVKKSDLLPTELKAAGSDTENDDGAVTIGADVLDTFPGLEAYLDMLSKAVRIGDAELIGHIAHKTAAIFSNYANNMAQGVKSGSMR